MSQIKPLYFSPDGKILQAESGDTLNISTTSTEVLYVTLNQAATPNMCCALVDYTAIPVNSVNLPSMNYRKEPYVDCVILEAGSAGDVVRAAVTHGKKYITPIEIDYTNNDLLYLGKDSLITTVPPTLVAGDKWFVIVGRLVNLTEFIFDPETPVDLTQSGTGELPSPIGHTGKALFSDGSAEAKWRFIKQTDIKANFAITSFACSITELELGAHLINPTFTFTANETLASLEIIDNFNNISTPIVPATSPFIDIVDLTRGTPGGYTFTLTAHNANNDASTASASPQWKNRRYFGAATKYDGTVTLDEFVKALESSNLSNSLAATFKSAPGSGENIYYAIPTSFGTPRFFVGGFEGGFILRGTVDITNNYSIIINYSVWESENSNLGETIVVVQ